MSQRLIARRYAKALLELAVKANEAGQVEKELLGLQKLVREHADLARLVAAPLISPSRKAAAFDAILVQAGAGTLVRRFFQVVTQAARLELFHEIVAAFLRLQDERNGIVEAYVTAAQPLTKEQADHLSQALGRRTGKTIRLAATQDPRLLGGLKVQIGSTVYDASLDGQLRQLKARLLSA